MKRLIICIVAILSATTQLFSQAKQPTLMVVPSDLWCFERGYYKDELVMGVIERVPDYKRALSSEVEMLLAITKIGELMSDAGFPLKDLGSTLKSLEISAMEQQHIAQSEGGVAESSLDKIRATAKADIWMSISYAEEKSNFGSSMLFIIQGLDAYTNKQVAASSGTVSNQGGESPSQVLLGAVNNNMSAFCTQLQNHFDSLFELGREVTLECKISNSSMINFDSQIGDDMLGFMIEDWVAENTQEGRFSTTDATEFVLKFDQVRIPMESASGRALDTRTWARGLVRELMSKHRVRCTLGMRGLGQAYIVVTGSMD